jgi:hypothetical protein
MAREWGSIVVTPLKSKGPVPSGEAGPYNILQSVIQIQ